MSRLASFQGPSTPLKKPNPSPSSPSNSTPTKGGKASKSKQSGKKKGQTDHNDESIETEFVSSFGTETTPIETEIHKTLRTILLRIRKATEEWDELVQNGFRAAKEMVDARTSIQNAFSILLEGQKPQRPIVGPHMTTINKRIAALDNSLKNLRDRFDALVCLMESLESLCRSAMDTFYGLGTSTPAAIQLDPTAALYPTTTWSFVQFCTVIPPTILPFYHRQLHSLQLMSAELCKPDLEWEKARSLLAVWKEGGRALAASSSLQVRPLIFGTLVLEPGWSDDLEDICTVEISGWKTRSGWPKPGLGKEVP